jgi:hypothetical protein
MAYQLGFDLYESATQQFLQRVQSSLRAKMPGASSSQQQSAAAESVTPMDVDRCVDKNFIDCRFHSSLI